MPDFVIHISTPADLTGAQATKAVMDAIGSSTVTVTEGATNAAAATGRFTDSAGRLREANGRYVETGNSAQQAGKQIGEAEREASHLLETLKTGVGIDIGHRIVEGVAEIPAAFREAIQEGVNFNAEIEKLSINFGSAMRASDPAKFLSFAEAKQAGVEALEIIRQKSNELGLSFTEVAHGFSINLAALREGGVKDTQQQIDLMIRLNQLTAAKGISGMQSQRDIIDLLQGRGERTIFGKELEPLGITNESIKQARELGTLADLILSKTQAYGEAAAASADTFGAAQQRLKSETEQLYGEIAKPVFAELKEQYQLLSAEITKPEVAESLRSLGYDIATVVEAGGGLIRFVVENASVLVPLGTAIGAVTFALAAYKTAQIASIIGTRLTTIVAETEATAAHAASVVADTAAVEANTVAKVAGAGAGWGAALGAAGAGAIGGTIALGLLPGAAIYGARQHAANQEGERDQEIGEESSTRTDQATSLMRELAAATTLEEQTKKRKDMTDLLAGSQQTLNGLLAEQTKFYDDSDNVANGASFDEAKTGKIADLKVYVEMLGHAIERSDKLAGKHPLADTDAKKGDDALSVYQNSPEYRLSQAEASGDDDEIEKARFDVGVAKKQAHLEKAGIRPEDADIQARYEVSAADNRQQEEADAKEKERDDAKAAREAEQAQKKSDREAEQAQKKADKAAADATADARQREAAIGGEEEEIAIAQARGAGEDDLADKLTRQRDIRLEIIRLQGQGLGDAEAQALAEEKINAKQDEQERKKEDRAAKHISHPEGWFITQGFRDPDKGDGLHSGTLDGHTNSADRFAGAPDAAATALANAPTTAGALAAAPRYVPSFGSVPTAAASLSPIGDAVARSNVGGSGSAPGGVGDGGVTSAAQGAGQAAQGAAQATGQTTTAMQQVATALTTVTSALNTIKGEQTKQASQLAALTAIVQNLNSGG